MMRAPHGAIAWTPALGWLYSSDDVPADLEDGGLVLVVSNDGQIRGVTPHDRAPLEGLLRVDGDVSELVERIGDLADQALADTASTADVRELTARMDAVVHRVTVVEELHARLAERVSDLGDRAEGLDTGLATEIGALQRRLGRLEGRL